MILNRVRHPAFPATVCGVVYQGSEKSTGCQFSYACDGSMARVPMRSAMDRARRYALEALNRRLAVICPPGPIRRAFGLTGLDAALPLYTSREEAHRQG